MSKVVWFDTETTGLDPAKHVIIQLAAIVTDGSEQLEEFEVKIEFDESLADPEALKLNSFDRHAWNSVAVPEAEAVAQIATFLNRHRSIEMVSKRTGRPYKVARVGAHNARFDCDFLRALFKRNGAFLPADVFRPLDTLALALWWVYLRGPKQAPPKDYKLGTLGEYFGLIEDDGRPHDAMDDVRLTVGLVDAMWGRLA